MKLFYTGQMFSAEKIFFPALQIESVLGMMLTFYAIKWCHLTCKIIIQCPFDIKFIIIFPITRWFLNNIWKLRIKNYKSTWINKLFIFAIVRYLWRTKRSFYGTKDIPNTPNSQKSPALSTGVFYLECFYLVIK